MEYKIKLGATLTFDKEQESDIVEQMEDLKSRHKLGEFISCLIRVAFENPEIMNKYGLSFSKFGVTDNRRAFFDDISNKIKEMNTKIDKVYDLGLKTYGLAQFNKKMALEQKSSNILQAQFILQRQVAELCQTLGVSSINNTYESNKIFNLSKNVDETLEFIIEYYDGITAEIKNSLVGVGTKCESSIVLEDKIVEVGEVKVGIEEVTEVVEEDTFMEDLSQEDEPIDFGGSANIDMLINFMG